MCWGYGEKCHFWIDGTKLRREQNHKSEEEDDSINSAEDIGDALVLSMDTKIESWNL